MSCKRFNEVFGLEQNIENIIFWIDEDMKLKEFPKRLTRRYRHVRLRNLSVFHFNDKKLKLHLKSLIHHVTDLQLTHSVVDMKMFCKILCYFHRLENLTLHKVIISNARAELKGLPDSFPNLKNLEIDVTCNICSDTSHIYSQIVKNFVIQKKHDLSILKLHFLSKKLSNENKEVLVNFIYLQKSLKELHITGKLNRMFVSPLSFSSTEIETFVIDNDENFKDGESYANLMNVVSSMQKLNDLKIPICSHLTTIQNGRLLSNIFNFPLNNLDLTFHSFTHPIKTSVSPNLSVRSVKVNFKETVSMSPKIVESISASLSKKFANVKHLTFSNDLDICKTDTNACLVYKFLSCSAWGGLVSLDLCNFLTPHSCISNLTFPDLQELKLFWIMSYGTLYNHDTFCNFLANHPKIVNLQLYTTLCFNPSAAKLMVGRSLKSLKNLQRMTFIKIGKKDISGYTKLEEDLEDFFSIIEENANPGFELSLKCTTKNRNSLQHIESVVKSSEHGVTLNFKNQ